MNGRRALGWIRIGSLTALLIYGQEGTALAGALERAMLGKSLTVELSHPLPDEKATIGSAEPVTRLYIPLGSPPGQRTISRIPLRELLLHAVVIDIRTKVRGTRDYRVGVEDLLAWEQRNGRIPKRSMVLLRTGAAPKGEGAGQLPDASGPEGPGFSPAAMALLVQQREIGGVGQDSRMVEPPPPGPADAITAGRTGTLQLEYLINLDRLPPKGAKLIVAPLRTEEESAPARVIAILP
jgi:kynurenine formamidase